MVQSVFSWLSTNKDAIGSLGVLATIVFAIIGSAWTWWTWLRKNSKTQPKEAKASAVQIEGSVTAYNGPVNIGGTQTNIANAPNQLVGDMHVYGGGTGIEHHEHHHHARQVAKLVLPWHELPARNAPDLLQLLTWRTRLGPLVGRESDKSELLTWAKSRSETRVRFLTGEGGAGKTRLAAEIAESLKASGWAAGFVDLEHDAHALLDQRDKPLLLLVDYPEENRGRVEELLKALAGLESGSSSVRLLLLSRQPMARWQQLIDDSGATALCDSQEFDVQPFKVADAITLCRAVWPRLEEKYGFAVPSVENATIAKWLEQNPSLHGRPLFVTAAAVHAAVEPQRSFSPGGKVVQALVRWELKRLRIAGKGHGFRESAVSRLAALAAVSGGLSASALRRLAEPALEIGLPTPTRIVDAVSKLPWWREGGFKVPSPDVVAAALLQQVLSSRSDMAPEWLWAALQDQAQTNEQASALASRLDRIGYDIRTVFGSTEHRIDEWLARMVEGNLERVNQLWRFGYQTVHDGALLLSVAINRTRLQDAELSNEERASILNNLGNRLSALGDLEGALVATQEAVGIRRKLAQSHPEAFLPDLATSLNNLGVMLKDIGDREGALEVTKEAVSIRRKLAQSRPEALLPDLAMSLNNLGAMLSALGDVEGALVATQEAVSIQRKLAQSHPEAFLPDLATSLSNLGNQLSDIGDRGGALIATQEAVSIRRKLAQSHPEAFLPDLAMSLNNLGNKLSALGDREGALEATQEAVSIRRELAESRPKTFLPDLAMSLNSLGSRLSAIGDREGALEATQEAVGIRRELAESHPKTFLPDLAGSLSNLGATLSAIGDREGALETTKEAVDLYRKLAQSHPEAFLPDLATSLNNLGAMLSDIGDREGALEATQEAVELYRKLAQSHSKAFLLDLARSLNNLGAMSSAIGDREGALEASKEAVDLYRKLAQSHPDAFLPDLATSLNNLGAMLSDIGDREGALDAAKGAVSIRGKLAKKSPHMFADDLARSANSLELCLKESGLPTESNSLLSKARAMLSEIGISSQARCSPRG